MRGINITPVFGGGNPFANPISLRAKNPFWPLLLASHEDAPKTDSSQLTVCRFCGQVKRPFGWTNLCLRRLEP